MLLQPTKEQIFERIQRLRLVDDVFMNAFFKHNKQSAQFMLRIIMNKPELVVTDVNTQDEQPNSGWRSVTLDILAIDEKGRRINVEVQLDMRGTNVLRARFHASLIDSKALRAGQDFAELPEVWVIFITERDCFGRGKPLYHFVRREEEGDGLSLNDGSHIIYINAEHQQAGTALGDLMHDLFCRDVAHMRLAELAQAVQRFKTSEEGVREMRRELSGIWKEELDAARGEIMEEVRAQVREEVREKVRAEALTEGREEGREEGRAALRGAARQLLRMEGFTPEVVARITSLELDEVQRLAAGA